MDDYASSENEADELMEEAEDIEADNDVDDEHDHDEDEQDDEEEPEPEADAEAEPEAEPEADNEPYDNSQSAPDGGQTRDPGTRRASAASGSGISGIKYRPVIRPEYTSASFYDIVPTMAAPQATSINAIAITPDQRYWITGGSDGYVRKYDGIGTINGKQQLTVAQRHPFVDSVVKAGILMGYWGNEEPTPPGTRAEEAMLSPVYSLAVHSEALWLLSGLESGGINLYSVRHDEGKRIVCLREGGHTNAVSVLQLAPDERSVLSGSWDKSCLDWDLNNGQIVRRFDGSGGGQISAIELRPTGAAPIPAEASEVLLSDTFQSNNDKPPIGNFYSTAPSGGVMGPNTVTQPDGIDNPGSPEHESLFGSPAGSLFGDNDTIGGGGGAFGDDDDNEFSRAMDMEMNNHSNNDMGQSADFSLEDVNMVNAPPLDATTADSTQQTTNANPIDLNTTSEPAPPPTQNGNPLDVNTSEATSHTLPGTNPDENKTTMSLDFTTTATTTTEPPPPATQDTDTSLPDAPNNNPPSPSHQQQQQQQKQQPLQSPTMVFSTSATNNAPDTNPNSPTTFLSASIDGILRIWDRRVPDPVARINNRRGVPPWCMGACWSLSGNEIYCGRRNGTVEEFSIHKASPSWQPERALKLPNGSGAVSAVRPMPNGRHLICASHDILRLYDLQYETDLKAQKHSKVPFTIVPGPPRAGVISCLYIDPTSRVMVSAAGTRGWEGTSTEVLVGYEIHANA
ncbi:WD40-repeat-containing domain protein [Triangularia verruculosa]|uniref:WD40-repeat-containing domain protein n=1 Tax=Triangularia verruculosa TaxID=2587418 RepID=A0AAN6XBB4_9PEZI|nr:WD40-repeat-containing domain protein [Triangularia verruculosa]